MRYCKYTESGAFYTLLDGRGENMDELTSPPSVSLICEEFSTEGLIIVNDSLSCDFKIEAFKENGDPRRAGLAGVRCAVSLASSLGIRPSSQDGWYTIEFGGSRLVAKITSTEGPQDIISIKIEKSCEISYLGDLSDAPVDGWKVVSDRCRFVVFDEDVDDINVEGAGAVISGCREFAPDGTDVDFACPYAGGLKLRSFDKGSGKESFVSVDGAVASALAAYKSGMLTESDNVSVRIKTKGSSLEVSFACAEKPSLITVTGRASFIVCTY